MTVGTIVIASPHDRHDALEQSVRAILSDRRVYRVRSRQELTVRVLEDIGASYVFFPHWSWLIPENIHSRFRCVIFHMTDVPYGRGGSPLQNLIVRGHRQTMLSALQCVSEVDGGPVYLKRPLQLDGTAEEVLTRAAELTAGMIVEIVRAVPTPIPQQGEVVTFARRRPADGDLAPLAELGQVFDHIRMLDGDGYPPAFIETEHFRFEFSAARPLKDVVNAQVKITRRHS